MPDVTLVVRGISEAGDAEKLERALGRLGFVEEVNVDPEGGLVAVSYSGGSKELAEVEEAVRKAGHGLEPSPGAREVEEEG